MAEWVLAPAQIGLLHTLAFDRGIHLLEAADCFTRLGSDFLAGRLRW
jgi:hypothetical protein